MKFFSIPCMWRIRLTQPKMIFFNVQMQSWRKSYHAGIVIYSLHHISDAIDTKDSVLINNTVEWKEKATAIQISLTNSCFKWLQCQAPDKSCPEIDAPKIMWVHTNPLRITTQQSINQLYFYSKTKKYSTLRTFIVNNRRLGKSTFNYHKVGQLAKHRLKYLLPLIVS